MTDADKSISAKLHDRTMHLLEFAFGAMCVATIVAGEALGWGLTTSTTALLGLGAGIVIKRPSDMGRK